MDDGLQWTTKQLANGRWEVSVSDGTYAGWAMQKTEDQARHKALLRLRYFKDEAEFTERKRRELEGKD